MLLYLVQHAEAKREEEDPTRPLSEKGLEDIKKLVSHLSHLNLKVDEIFHSAKLRAKQTAEVLNKNLKSARGLSETDGLTPLDDPSIWADRMRGKINDVMLVGHLPHLGKLASLLLSGDTDKNIVAFRTAGIVCLERDDLGVWSLQWMVTPDIISQ